MRDEVEEALHCEPSDMLARGELRRFDDLAEVVRRLVRLARDEATQQRAKDALVRYEVADVASCEPRSFEMATDRVLYSAREKLALLKQINRTDSGRAAAAAALADVEDERWKRASLAQ